MVTSEWNHNPVESEETTAAKLNRQGATILLNLSEIPDDSSFFAEVLSIVSKESLFHLEYQDTFEAIERFRQTHNRWPDQKYLESEGVAVPEEDGIDAISFDTFSVDMLSDYLSSLKQSLAARKASDLLAEERLVEAHGVLSDQITRQRNETLPDPVTGQQWREQPPDREWLIPEWLPKAELCSLYGPGSIGKGILTLQMASALASTRRPCPWIDPKGAALAIPGTVRPTTCVMAGWEDSREEILRRIHRLAGPGECHWVNDDGILENLIYLPMRGKGPLWESQLTPMGEQLRHFCEGKQAELLVIDPINLSFAVDEINRPEVSKALESWAGWAMDTGCTVLLVGHPAKATEGDAAIYSGSTAWESTVRCMWVMRREKQGRNGERDPNPTLRLHKSNLGPRDLSVPLHPYYKGSGDGLASWRGFRADASGAKGSNGQYEAEADSDDDTDDVQLFRRVSTGPVEVAR